MVLWGRSVWGCQKVTEVSPKFFESRGVSGFLGQIRLGLPKVSVEGLSTKVPRRSHQGSTKALPRFHQGCASLLISLVLWGVSVLGARFHRGIEVSARFHQLVPNSIGFGVFSLVKVLGRTSPLPFLGADPCFLRTSFVELCPTTFLSVSPSFCSSSLLSLHLSPSLVWFSGAVLGQIPFASEKVPLHTSSPNPSLHLSPGLVWFSGGQIPFVSDKVLWRVPRSLLYTCLAIPSALLHVCLPVLSGFLGWSWGKLICLSSGVLWGKWLLLQMWFCGGFPQHMMPLSLLRLFGPNGSCFRKVVVASEKVLWRVPGIVFCGYLVGAFCGLIFCRQALTAWSC